MKSRRHTDRGYYVDRNIEIYNRYEGGESVEVLAKEYELSPITIRAIIRQKGMPRNDTSYYFNYMPDMDELDFGYTVMPKGNTYRRGS